MEYQTVCLLALHFDCCLVDRFSFQIVGTPSDCIFVHWMYKTQCEAIDVVLFKNQLTDDSTEHIHIDCNKNNPYDTSHVLKVKISVEDKLNIFYIVEMSDFVLKFINSIRENK